LSYAREDLEMSALVGVGLFMVLFPMILVFPTGSFGYAIVVGVGFVFGLVAGHFQWQQSTRYIHGNMVESTIPLLGTSALVPGVLPIFLSLFAPLMGFVTVGPWILMYTARFWLYERRNGPLYFTERASLVAEPGVTVQGPGFKAKYKIFRPDRSVEPLVPEPETLEPQPDFVDLTPYTGRWVALLHDEVAGVGTSAADARLTAKLQWGDEPIVVFVPGVQNHKPETT
jgi:hypothetical protein